ncbi:class I SAM-dependent methyltransferase [Dysgonomonas sp. 520]|uniref:class I SAM-dependent methyltransferase n=1 Tax=Dysgonomonas sp. 520 TaxID=2302931 RepID=UPI0013D7577F|nr:class I SAM-dependent methyltransferase [Dysgonomonas sp. 520]NDW09895.1 SAM-dependent methyltransferase [Dysgonomonas sp. 520]
MTPLMQAFVLEHENDDLQKLILQSARYPDIDIPFAVQQIKGRRIAKEKTPSWYANKDIVYPKHLSLEQSSSEATASYKAKLFGGDSFVDLTGGMGVDFSFLARNYKHSVYVESQPYLSDLTRKNLNTLGIDGVTVLNEDGVAYLNEMDHVDTIYIDPARRDTEGRKTVKIEDCSPNIAEIDDILNQKSDIIVIKLSPMLDISLALESVTNVSDVYVISHKNECKELLLVKKTNASLSEVMYHCVNIKNDNGTDEFSFTKQEELSAHCEYTSQIGHYLYEPNASVMKAGAYKVVAERYGLKKFHANSHLYTSSKLHEDFPGRRFKVMTPFSLNKREIKEYIGGLDKANIAIRNFPVSVDELRKRLKMKDGGEDYIFATTLYDSSKVLILCRKA